MRKTPMLLIALILFIAPAVADVPSIGFFGNSSNNVAPFLSSYTTALDTNIQPTTNTTVFFNASNGTLDYIRTFVNDVEIYTAINTSQWDALTSNATITKGSNTKVVTQVNNSLVGATLNLTAHMNIPVEGNCFGLTWTLPSKINMSQFTYASDGGTATQGGIGFMVRSSNWTAIHATETFTIYVGGTGYSERFAQTQVHKTDLASGALVNGNWYYVYLPWSYWDYNALVGGKMLTDYLRIDSCDNFNGTSADIQYANIRFYNRNPFINEKNYTAGDKITFQVYPGNGTTYGTSVNVSKTLTGSAYSVIYNEFPRFQYEYNNSEYKLNITTTELGTIKDIWAWRQVSNGNYSNYVTNTTVNTTHFYFRSSYLHTVLTGANATNVSGGWYITYTNAAGTNKTDFYQWDNQTMSYSIWVNNFSLNPSNGTVNGATVNASVNITCIATSICNSFNWTANVTYNNVNKTLSNYSTQATFWTTLINPPTSAVFKSTYKYNYSLYVGVNPSFRQMFGGDTNAAVYNLSAVSFTTTPSLVNAGQTYMMNSTQAGYTYFWNLFNSTAVNYTTQNITHLYDFPGIYNVTVIVNDAAFNASYSRNITAEGLYIKFYDETTHTPVAANVSITNGTVTVTNNSASAFQWNNLSNGIPVGTLTITSGGNAYITRISSTYFQSNSPVNMTVFMLGAGAGVYPTFFVQTSDNIPLSGVSVSAYRSFGSGVYQLVETKTTDTSGLATFFLEYGVTYRIVASRSGCSPYAAYISPLSQQYVVTMCSSSSINFVNVTKTSWALILPETTNLIMNMTNITFFVNDANASVVRMNVSIFDFNKKLLWNVEDTTSVGNTIKVNVSSLDLSSANIVRFYAIMNLTLREGTSLNDYNINRSYWLAGTFYNSSLYESVTKVRAELNDEAAMVLAFILTLVLTSTITYKLGTGGGLIAILIMGAFTAFGWVNVELYGFSVLVTIGAYGLKRGSQ